MAKFGRGKSKAKVKQSAASLKKRVSEVLAGKVSIPENIPVNNITLPVAATLRGKTRIHEDLSALYIKELMQETQSYQEELEESSAKYSDLYDHAPIGYFTFDWNSRIVDVNQTGALLVGLEKDSLFKTPFVDLILEKDQAVFKHHLKEVFEENKRQVCEVQLRGTARMDSCYVQLESVPVSDSRGHFNICRTVISDISKRKLAVRHLKMFKKIFTYSKDAIIICDAEGLLLEFNAAYEEMLGFRQEELIGKNPLIHVDKKLIEFCVDEIKRCGSHRGEFTLTSKIGVEKHVEMTTFSVLNDMGEITSLVGILRDISLRKDTESALRQSQQKWKSLVQNAPGWILTCDRDGVILFINRVSQGISTDDVIGTNIFDYILPDYKSLVRDRLAKVFSQGTAEQFEIETLNNLGVSRWHSTVVGPVIVDGEVRSAMFVGTDISNRKKAEQYIEEASCLNGIDADGQAIEIQILHEELTNEALERVNQERVIREIADGVSKATGEEFFQSLTKNICKALQTSHAFVGLLLPDGKSMRGIAASEYGNRMDNFECQLEHTPCYNVIGKEICFYPDRVRELFPKAEILQQSDVVSYLGAPIYDAKGRALGVMSVMHKYAMPSVELTKNVFRIFHAKCSAEIERQNSEDKYLETISRLQSEIQGLKKEAE